MDQCSRHDIPPAVDPLTDRRGHDLGLELLGSAHSSAHPPAARDQHALRLPVESH